ncbi:MAG: cbb3-type cytochrome oxidase assembly protein CcoS [Chromatiaceae bacterium]|nr:cbb3-type cytochrome oxidase assembly protein CcoS [Gammaproteobacteria bacterium]MCP5448178.1 cbb3-type cytochrome oxidase assembly protein CcoS [Chromatiaceae bacterium]MCB1862271.1 cbb3-type cytochrome oxidase assembly protein CcoS [Gammaproteobacteria bacterium]MCB1871943.1 cbb3-type cytochrome oxidase assembly protein CcoS [Gammaproteobacteria bacterium]MCB1878527.1 cbb3-type cytochrome oxidase assembly protein CcoS [Gammaproteobacteria bacterium]
MDVIYGLIPGMIILGLVGVGVFFWAARSGQFDDLEGEASRILMDEDLSSRKSSAAEGKGEPEKAEKG